MEDTPRLPKKSLSLGARKHSKSHKSSPQCRLQIFQSNASSNDIAHKRSPSVKSMSPDCIEFTPPHKKVGLDDSFSPRSLDFSLSPSGMLSQTLSTQSPEVSWRWNRAQNAIIGDSSPTADISNKAHTPADLKLKRVTLARERQERRRLMERQKRKAETLKVDEMLIRRCAKLQKQLQARQKNSSVQEEKKKDEVDVKQSCITKSSSTQLQTDSLTALQSIARSADTTSAISSNTQGSIDEFFNDSEFDGLLLEATQQFELEIGAEKTKNTAIACTEPSSAITTPKSSHDKKRSSFYSKFLEDDSADDWFVSFDDVALQAAQNAKPRTPLQRYKSLPTNTNTRIELNELQKASSTNTTSNFNLKCAASDTNRGSAKSFKRHVSSHQESLSSNSCKFNEKHMRSRIER